MNRRRWIRGVLLFAAIVATPIIGYHLVWGPLWFYSPPITGTVVDEETGKPLPGAAVVAVWQLYTLDYAGERMQETEALSRSDGTFVIPKWGPRLRPLFDHISRRDPVILVYKPGYQIERFKTTDLEPSRSYGAETRHWPTIISPWSGKHFPIARSKSFESDCTAIAAMHEHIREPHATDVSVARRFPQTVRLIREGIRRVPPAKRVSDCYETTYLN